MGKHGLGAINENGEGPRSKDLRAKCDLVIGGSLFLHKAAHKATWVSPKHIRKSTKSNRHLTEV